MGSRPKMSMADRAAQFMPFAALTGYYDLVRDAERHTEPRHELNEEEEAQVNEALLNLRPRELVRVTYYRKDAYVTQEGVVVHIDVAARELQVVRTHIPFADIRSLEVTGQL